MLIKEPIIDSWSVSSVDDIIEEEPFFSAGISDIVKEMNDNLPLVDQLEFILKKMPGIFSLQKHVDIYSSLPDFIITQYSDSFQNKEMV